MGDKEKMVAEEGTKEKEANKSKSGGSGIGVIKVKGTKIMKMSRSERN